MGIGIINCFMIVLAFLAIPSLLHDYTNSGFHGESIPENQPEYMKPFPPYYSDPFSITASYH
jgi:hypothetical protein